MGDKISILGPNYSYCHILALKLFPDKEFVLCNNIIDVFRNVAEEITGVGLAPIENMIHGTVRESLTALQKYRIKINKTYDLPIHHCLASKSEKFNKIVSHTQAIGQCSLLLEQYRKRGIEIVESSSTSKAMEIASKDREYASIGSPEAAKYFNLIILRENIEDNHDNSTRFIFISKEANSEQEEKARTSLMVIPKEDKPGLLFEVLKIFKERDINLTKIESIPTGKKMGEYEFFIEIDGNVLENETSNAIAEIKELYEVYVFGSYKLERIN